MESMVRFSPINNSFFLRIIEKDAQTKDSINLGYGFCRGEDVSSRDRIESNGYVLEHIEVNDELVEKIRVEASDWVIEEHYSFDDYDDLHRQGQQGSGVCHHQIFKREKISNITSLEETAGYIIIENDHFEGVALPIKNIGGNGWDGRASMNYCLLFVDGTIVGNNRYSYSFSGEDSSKFNEEQYFLKKRSEAEEPWSKKSLY